MVVTRSRVFYHGTGATSAQGIFMPGGQGSWLEQIGARSLGREIRDAILAVKGISLRDAWRLNITKECHGIECRSPWVQALLISDDDSGSHSYQYGHFCVTLAQSIAYRYALGNPYRSEFIHALADGLRVLSAFGHPLPRLAAGRYPEVHSALNDPSPPVVLEIQGVRRERLLTDERDENIDVLFEEYDLFGQDPGYSAPFEFRVRDITADDIVAVYDLYNWPSVEDRAPPWRPEPSRVIDSRLLTHDWLHQQERFG